MKLPAKIWFFLMFCLCSLTLQGANIVGNLKGELAVSQGSLNYDIPLNLPPGTAGVKPQVSLHYNSNGGNGYLGIGWGITNLSVITRCGYNLALNGKIDKVRHNSNDNLCLDGQQLVLVSGNKWQPYSEYRTKIDSFSKIEFDGANFKVWTKSGEINEYTKKGDDWYITKKSDRFGNSIHYFYYNDASNETYLTKIKYADNEIVFNYSNRGDRFGIYHAGTKHNITKRLSNISIKNGSSIIRKYYLSYSTATGSSARSVLTSFKECDSRGECLKPLTFEYDIKPFGFLPPSHAANSTVYGKKGSGKWDTANNPRLIADMDADGLPDIIGFKKDGTYISYNQGGNSFASPKKVLSTFGSGTAAGKWKNKRDIRSVADINGDGLMDIIGIRSDGFYVSVNEGNGNFSRAVRRIYFKSHFDSADFKNNPAYILDLNRDGLPDITVFAPSGVYVFYNNANLNFKKPVYIRGSINKSTKMLVDTNADGFVDIVQIESNGKAYVARAKGDGTFLSFGQFFSFDYFTNWNLFLAADMNGDGMADFIGFKPDGVYISNGPAKAFKKEHLKYFGSGWSNTRTPRMLSDLNGDGLPDVVGFGKDGVYVSLNKGNFSFEEPKRILDKYGVKDGWNDTTNYPRMVVDVNGDGMADIAGFSNSGLYISYNKKFTTKLIAITDSFGNRTKIGYKSLTDDTIYKKYKESTYPNISVQLPMDVVSVVEYPSYDLGSTKTSYKYGGLKFNVNGLGSLGFASITSYNHDSGIKILTEYHQDYPFTGLLKKSYTYIENEIIDESESFFSKTRDNGVFRVWLARQWDKTYDNGNLVKTVDTTVEVDRYNNTVSSTVTTTDETKGEIFSESIHNTFTNNEDDWILARLTEAAVTKNAYGTSITKRSIFTYDDRTGILLSETIEPDSDKWLKKVYVYDSFGNRIKEIVSGADIKTRTTSYKYDGLGKNPIQITNPLGFNEFRDYDKDGNLIFMKDPNGLVTKWTYDGFGKKIKELRSDGTSTTISYSFDRTAPKSYYKIETKTDGNTPVAIYYNRLDKKVREERISFDGKKIYIDFYYDKLGNLVKKSTPYFKGGTRQYTTITYDKFQRPVKTHFYSSALRRSIETLTTYNGFTTTITNAKGQMEKKVVDVFGNVILVEQEEGASQRYEYDADGNLIKTIDSKGNSIIAKFDIFGNKIYQKDPDLGEWSYAYNALGQLISQTDAKGNTYRFKYDLLGRKVQEVINGEITHWIYDTKFKGQLSKEAKNGFEKSYTYDKFGRVVSIKTSCGSKNFVQNITYDSYGRIATTSLPNSFKIINVYNSFGYLDSIKSPKTQIKDFDPDHFVSLIGNLLTKAGEYKKLWIEFDKKGSEYFLKASEYKLLGLKYKQDNEYLLKQAERLKAAAIEFKHAAEKMRKKAEYYKKKAEYFLNKANHSRWFSRFHYTFLARIFNSWSYRYNNLANEALINAEKNLEKIRKIEEIKKKISYYIQIANEMTKESIRLRQIAKNFRNKYNLTTQNLDAMNSIAADENYNYFYKVIRTDAAGHITAYVSGNGLITEKNFDTSTGVLTNITTGYDYDNTVRDLKFEYDELNNVTFKTDRKLGVTQLFRYDSLNRLTSAYIHTKSGSSTTTYSYDTLGNIIYKSDVGNYNYNPAKPHQVLSAGNRHFAYDANGNMTNNNGTLITYTAFNKPETIKTKDDLISFYYDTAKNRYKKETKNYTTWYVGKSYEEKIYKDGGTIERRYFIYANGKVVAIYTDKRENGNWIPSTKYLHYDSLNSVDTITNNLGVIEARFSYKPFGQKLNLDKNGNPTSKAPFTNRGFTGHEHIEETPFIHMNARLYDPIIGRFLSADTLIPNVFDTQSFNRYSYVRNNPLKYTDPTGHFGISSFFKPFSNLFNWVKNNAKTVVSIVAAIAITTVTLGAGSPYAASWLSAFGGNVVAATMASGALSGAVVGAIMTGTPEGALRGALYGAISAAFAYGIGEEYGHSLSFFDSGGNYAKAAEKAVAHGISRVAIAKARNRSAKAAFWSGFAASGFSMGNKGYGGVPGRTLITAAVSGTVSEATGGKFANGAVSGAFIHLFNAENGVIEFIKGIDSVRRGLIRLGDFLARISGFRDWQEGSVMGNFYQEQAFKELSYAHKIISYIASNQKARSVFLDSAKHYISANPEYFAGRALAGPIVGTAAVNPVWSLGSATGDVLHGMKDRDIDNFARDIILGY